MANNEEVIMMMPSQNQGVPIPQRSDRADLLDKIKPEGIVEVIRHRLMGHEWLDNTWVPNKALQRNALSEEGAWEISNLMLGVSSINISISKIKEQVIKERLKRIAKAAQINMVSNWRRYGITSSAQFDFVHQIVFSNTMAVLMQAGDGSIQELLKGTVQENRNVTTEKKEAGRLKRWLGMG